MDQVSQLFRNPWWWVCNAILLASLYFNMAFSAAFSAIILTVIVFDSERKHEL